MAVLSISGIFFTHFIDHPILNISIVFPVSRNNICSSYRLGSKDLLQLSIIYAVHLGLNVEVSLGAAVLVCGKSHSLVMLYPDSTLFSSRVRTHGLGKNALHELL